MGVLKILVIGFLLCGSFAMAQSLSTTIQLKNGKPLVLESLPKYQLFYFWATWCPDCKEKMASDLSLYQKPDLELVAIATDKDLQKVSDYLSANKVGVSVFFDEKKELQKYFKVFSVPTVVLTQKKGNSFEIVQQVVGSDWSDIKAKIQELKL